MGIQQLLEFPLADPVEFLRDGQDGRFRNEALHPLHEFCDAIVDHAQALTDGLMPRLQVFVRGLLQGVNVVDVHVIELVDRRFDVAGHGDIDDKHGSVGAFAQGALEMAGIEERRGGCCGCHDDIRPGEGLVEILEGHGFPAQFFSQDEGLLMAPVDEENVADSVREQAFQGTFAHLARTDNHDRLVGQVDKDRHGQIDGDRRDGNLSRSDSRLGTDLFRDGKGALEQGGQDLVDGFLFLSECEGFVDLSEDLGFTDDEAVEARRHAKEVADGLGAFVFVERRLEFPLGDVVPACDESADIVAEGCRVFFVVGINFDAVAGAEDHRGAAVKPVLELIQGRRDGLCREMKPFPQSQRARMMAETDRYDAHVEGSQK